MTVPDNPGSPHQRFGEPPEPRHDPDIRPGMSGWWMLPIALMFAALLVWYGLVLL